jgi:RNA recognition motif-containing protein
VRNLSFKAKEADLEEAFTRCVLCWGTTTTTITHLPSSLPPSLSRFGPLDQIHIPTVEVAEESRSGETRTVHKSRGFAFVQFACLSDAQRTVSASSAAGISVCGRDVTAAFAVGKREQAAAPPVPRAAAAAAAGSDADSGSDSDSGSGSDSDSDAGDSGTDSAAGSDEDDSEDDDSEDERRRRRPSDVATGCTVFVRNLSFQATDEDVQAAFGAYVT